MNRKTIAVAEFIYVLEGQPTLHTDEGRTQLTPGVCVRLVAGTGDEATFSDDDLKAVTVDGKWKFSYRNGNLYA